MLDRAARRLIDPALNRLGPALADRGWTADRMTLLGLALGLAGAGLITLGWTLAALVLVLAGRVADGLDGAIARAQQPAPLGGYYDILADFLFYGAIPTAFVIQDPAANGVAGAVLLLSFYVNGASFLGFATEAAKRNLQGNANGPKSFFHSVGLVEGSETILFIVLICLYPEKFNQFAWVFAFLCFAAAALRLRTATLTFAKDNE